MPVPPGPLLESLANRRCLPFVGSGLSVPAGFPSWSQLLDRLVKEAAAAYPEKAQLFTQYAQTHPDPLLVAEYARDKLGPQRYGMLLKEIFDKKVKPLATHEDIAATDYRAIVTTNFDRLIELAIIFKRESIPSVFTHDERELGTALYDDKRLFVFKLHGDIARPSSVVLTDRDYDQLIFRSPALRSFLQAIFLNFNLLFVGYSVSDPDFKLVLKELNLIFQGTTPIHYALLPDAHEFTSEQFAGKMNIQVISYDSHGGTDHSEVAAFLKQLQQAKPYAAAAP
jgi:hypothetical protein